MQQRRISISRHRNLMSVMLLMALYGVILQMTVASVAQAASPIRDNADSNALLISSGSSNITSDITSNINSDSTSKFASDSTSSIFSNISQNISSEAQVLDTENPAAVFEGGKLFRAGNLKVLVLRGSYNEMGRQYGGLMKDDLNEIYNIISADFGKMPGSGYDDMLRTGRWMYQSYPQRYKEILKGMAETSGLGLDKELIVCSMEYTYMPPSMQYSGIAAWGNYTSGGPLVFGRNYDNGPKLAEFVSVVVYNPEDGSIPVASLTYTGAVYVTTGMNREGIFLELNNGQPSEAMQLSNRVLSLATLFSFLESCGTLDQIDSNFHTSLPDNAFIINAANRTGAFSYEWATFNVARRNPDKNGLLVSTNHFVDPSWGVFDRKYLPTDLWDSRQRRENLLMLGEKCKGNFSAAAMMNIMSIPFKNGGFLMPPPHDTSYQVVAVPEDLTIWVKVSGVQDWTEVDLKPLFG